MKAAAAVLTLVAYGAFATTGWAAPKKAALSCNVFIESFTRATAGHKIVFERPLNITRGFLGDDGDLDVRVLSTGSDNVEGTLKCKGDEFRRFEVRIGMPADDAVIANLKVYELATLTAAFGWDKAKVQTVVTAMTSDAAEYLHASIERGDTYRAGKVEYHQGDALDLGMIWTEDDRSLIVTTQDN